MSLLHMWLSYCLLTFGCYNLTKEAIYLDFCKTWMKQNFRLHEHRAPTFSSLLAHLPTQLCREWKTEQCLLTQRWMNSDWQVNLLSFSSSNRPSKTSLLLGVIKARSFTLSVMMRLLPTPDTILLNVRNTPPNMLNRKRDSPFEFTFPGSPLTLQEPELKTFKAKAQ